MVGRYKRQDVESRPGKLDAMVLCLSNQSLWIFFGGNIMFLVYSSFSSFSFEGLYAAFLLVPVDLLSFLTTAEVGLTNQC